MSLKLKIKSKHLAQEAQIIRHEERKLLSSARWENSNSVNNSGSSKYHSYRNLREHRLNVVRIEARLTFLARAYIAGRPITDIETVKSDEEFWYNSVNCDVRIAAMVLKYGDRKTLPSTDVSGLANHIKHWRYGVVLEKKQLAS